ncbi:hypothetical protein RAA17_02500 [Komagataeibacter rhaeticus]|nr:hypothetical protein [Komagataeibacter rhaeticus]
MVFPALLRAAAVRAFQIRGLVAAGASIGVLFMVPWLDPSPVRSARSRPLCRAGMAGVVVSFVLMGLVGRHHAEGGWMIVGRVAALCYFGYFLVLLPLCARREMRRGG